MIEIQKYQPCSADLRPWSVSKYSRICKNTVEILPTKYMDQALAQSMDDPDQNHWRT